MSLRSIKNEIKWVLKNQKPSFGPVFFEAFDKENRVVKLKIGKNLRDFHQYKIIIKDETRPGMAL